MAISLKNIKSLLKQKQHQQPPPPSSINQQPTLTQLDEEEKQSYTQDEKQDQQIGILKELQCQTSLEFCQQLLKDQQEMQMIPQFNPNIEDFKAQGSEDAYYIKNYISRESEQKLLDCIFQLDQDKWFEMKSGRALKRYGGEVGATGLINQEPLPPYFEAIANQIFSQGFFPGENKPNHVLLNKYRPGDGIMPHKDGPAYFPYVCILSLNNGIMMNIYEKVDDIAAKKYCARFYMEPRSLLIFTGKHYEQHFHGIDEAIEDEIIDQSILSEEHKHLAINNLDLTNLDTEQIRGSRIIIPRDDERLSLTIRYVPLMKQSDKN